MRPLTRRAILHPAFHSAVSVKVPKVTVLIPAYNSAAFLPSTLHSVFAQDFLNFEVVCINDGSTDNTEEVIGPYRDRLIYISQANRGLPAALNAGLKISRGDLIAILDADDIWESNKLREQVQLFVRCPQIGLCFTNYTTFGAFASSGDWFSERGHLVWKYGNRRVSEHEYVFDGASVLLQLLTIRALPKPSSVMFRRECIERVGYFDESLTFIQDTQMWLRLGKYFNFGFTDLCLLRRRVHEKSLASVQTNRSYVLEHLRMLENLDAWIDLTPDERIAKEKLEAAYSLSAGYLDFTECLFRTSRKHFWKSLRRKFAFKTMLYITLTFIPKELVKTLRGLKQRMGSRASSSSVAA